MMKILFRVLLILLSLALFVSCTENTPEDGITEVILGTGETEETADTENSSDDTIKEEPMTMKIACLGDSITNLGGGAKTYVDFLGDDMLTLVTQNVGLSGSALGIPKRGGANPALSERYVQIDSDAEVILVFGGSNDYGHTDYPVTLGEVDSDSTDRATFCGALRYLITTLRAEHPDAFIVYATPMKRNDARWFASIGHKAEATGVNRFGYTLEDYASAGIAICEKLDCPVIDMYNHPELNPTIPEKDEAYYRDGLHLNDEGAKLLAAHFTAELKALLNAR